MTPYEAEKFGHYIGRAIARDVIAEGMPQEWTGLDPQDADRIPAGTSEALVDIITESARTSYEQTLNPPRNP